MVRRRELKSDLKLLLIIMALVVSGLIILYSASTVLSYSKFHTNTYYFTHQLLYGAVPGLIAMYLCSKIDYHYWQKFAPLLLFITIALLVVVLIPGIGFSVGRSRSWINTGFFLIQPAEIAKFALIVYLASWIDKRRHEIKDFYYGVIPSLLMIGLIAGLIFLQPDVGTMIVITAIAMAMMFVGGTRVKHLIWIFSGGILGMFLIIKSAPYRVARFTTFLNPSLDPQGIGYQINQALLAIGSGGLFGYGYGLSRQKYNFLPEVMGDSIFAVVVEELGFIRASILLLLIIIFALRALKVAKNAPDIFGKMLVVGIVSWITLQAFVNIGAIIGLMPLTGLPLPFVSYGSSSLVVILASMGVLLNVSKHSAI